MLTRHPHIRRTGAVILIVLGAVMMFLAADIWPGALVFAVGVLIELVGIALEHKTRQD